MTKEEFVQFLCDRDTTTEAFEIAAALATMSRCENNDDIVYNIGMTLWDLKNKAMTADTDQERTFYIVLSDIADRLKRNDIQLNNYENFTKKGDKRK
jgi:hypothetical protein